MRVYKAYLKFRTGGVELLVLFINVVPQTVISMNHGWRQQLALYKQVACSLPAFEPLVIHKLTRTVKYMGSHMQ